MRSIRIVRSWGLSGRSDCLLTFCELKLYKYTVHEMCVGRWVRVRGMNAEAMQSIVG
jgi:hypothetical protein